MIKININTYIKNFKKALSFNYENFDVALNDRFSLKENIQFYENWIAGKYKLRIIII